MFAKTPCSRGELSNSSKTVPGSDLKLPAWETVHGVDTATRLLYLLRTWGWDGLTSLAQRRSKNSTFRNNNQLTSANNPNMSPVSLPSSPLI